MSEIAKFVTTSIALVFAAILVGDIIKYLVEKYL